MKSTLLLTLLGSITSCAAWTRTDHWHTKVITTTSNKLFTSSIPVYPTATDAPKPTSTQTSLTTITSNVGGFLDSTSQTYIITVTDLFYNPSKTSGLCVSFGFRDCQPTPTLINQQTVTITTNYYHQLIISNPATCTQTSYEYTTRQSVNPPYLDTNIPDATRQATESAQALLVTTWISSLSTNLGGQAVTTTICDVYLKEGVIGGVGPVAERSAMSECVDPRVYTCDYKTSLTPGVECLTTGQTYPPTEASGVNSAVNTEGAGTTRHGGEPPVQTKPGAASGLGVRMGMMVAVVGGVVVFVL